MNLLRYIIKRVFIAIPMLLVEIIITFFLTRFIPGNPFMYNIRQITPAQIEYYYNSVRIHGLDQPITTQFIRYMRNLFTGNWGISWYLSYGTDVWLLIRYTLPITMEFLTLSILFSFLCGSAIGKVTAMRQSKKSNYILRILSTSGASLPIIFIAIVLIYFIAHSPFYMYYSGIKSYGMDDPTYITGFRLLDSIFSGRFDLLFDTFLHYLLPVLTFSIPLTVMVIRQTRNSMLDVLTMDYIRTARAKGCTDRRIQNKHAFRNAMIPTITYLGMTFNLQLSNSMLIEYIFQIPGFSFLYLSAIRYLDYNVIIAGTTFMIIFTITANLCIDILYAAIDPRIRY